MPPSARRRRRKRDRDPPSPAVSKKQIKLLEEEAEQQVETKKNEHHQVDDQEEEVDGGAAVNEQVSNNAAGDTDVVVAAADDDAAVDDAVVVERRRTSTRRRSSPQRYDGRISNTTSTTSSTITSRKASPAGAAAKKKKNTTTSPAAAAALKRKKKASLKRKKMEESEEEGEDEEALQCKDKSPSAATKRRGRSKTNNNKKKKDDRTDEADGTDYDEEDDDDGKNQRKKKTQHGRKREEGRLSATRKRKRKVEEESDDEESEDDKRDSLYDGDEKKTKTTTKTMKCPHCDKVFKVLGGLTYHVDNYVCRQEERPGGPVRRGPPPRRRQIAQPKPTKAAASASGDDDDDDYVDSNADDEAMDEEKAADGSTTTTKKKWRKVRGLLKDRTCPDCKRVFTSIFGCQYHVKKRVCQQLGTSNKIPCAQVRAGQHFVTPIGVVRVVKDDRERPPTADDDDVVAALPSSIEEGAKIAKNYKNVIHKRQRQADNFRSTVTVRHLARRKRLGDLYAKGEVNRRTVFEAYFGRKEDPRKHIDESMPTPLRAAPTIPADPLIPPCVKPDRIVECVLVADERNRHYFNSGTAFKSLTSSKSKDNDDDGSDDDDADDGDDTHASTDTTGIRVYLPRRLLLEPYNRKARIYICSVCGRVCTTIPGARYHQQAKNCVATAKLQEAAKKRLDAIEERAVRALGEPVNDVLRSPVKSLSVAANPAKAAALSSDADEVKKAPLVKKEPPAQDDMKRKDSSLTENTARAVKRPAFAVPLQYKKPKDKSVRALSVYPQVWLALEYKMLARNKLKTKERTVSAFKKGPNSGFPSPMTALDTADAPKDAPKQPPEQTPSMRADVRPALSIAEVDDPDIILRDLRYQLHIELGNAIGPMYPEVFRALSFLEPKVVIPEKAAKKKKKKKRAKRRKTLKEAPTQEAQLLPVVAPPQLLPLPPAVDTAVLVAEVEAGRYTSMRRYDGEKRDNFCWICKIEAKKTTSLEERVVVKQEEGYADACPGTGLEYTPLVGCDFCHRSIHYSCLRLLFTVKDLEPTDDVMCSNCIQNIQARRNRAEKRRTDRLETLNPAAASGGESDEKEDDATTSRELLSGVVPGKEYECVAEQGRRVSDLVDILSDSRRRLSECVEASKINALRLSMIGEGD